MSNEEILKSTNISSNYKEEHKQNQMQIDCIKKTLIERADVPEQLINWLIDSVRENTILEIKNAE